MLNKILGKVFTEDLAIDITSSRTVIYKHNHGIVDNQPSVVATEGDTYLAVGDEAELIRGKNPIGISVTCPVRGGCIAEPDLCSHMIEHGILKTLGRNKFGFGMFKFGPKILVATPHHSSPAEVKIFEEVFDSVGAREVLTVSSLISAAYGAKLSPESASASIICNINHEFTEIGIISMSKVHASTSLPIGYRDFIQAIVTYVRDETDYTIGEKSAEQILSRIGAAYYDHERDKDATASVSAMRKRSSVPEHIQITKKEVSEIVLYPLLKRILSGILEILEGAKEGMAEDIQQNGITLVGVGATLPRLDQALSACLHGMITNVANEPKTVVAKGAGLILTKMNSQRAGFSEKK